MTATADLPPSPVITWPAPATETASPDYTLTVAGQTVFVYSTRVRAEILQNDGLWTHKPDCGGERAAFAIFDTTGPVEVIVKPTRPFRTATVLPARANIATVVRDGTIRFTLPTPRHVTVVLDETDFTPLHLFVSEPERDVPRRDDPNVIYFGPGVHDIHGLEIKSGQTVYLAGGALVRLRLRPDAKGTYSEKWKVTFHEVLGLRAVAATGVRICGRGILDASQIPHPGGNMIVLDRAKDVRIEGITLRDAANWNCHIYNSDHVTVDNLRIISGRLNTDGINSNSSRDINIRRCFVRNHDDSIVCKSTVVGRPTENITVEDCVIWGDWGYAIGATYEVRAPIQRLRFRRCDLLFARHWFMGIHVSDAATVSDVVFDDIHVAHLKRTTVLSAGGALTDQPKLVRMVIQKDVWGHDAERGQIRAVRFDGITVDGPNLPASEMFGADAAHTIENIVFRNVRLRGKPVVTATADLNIKTNDFVRQVRIERVEP